MDRLSALKRAVADHLGGNLASARPLHGGDLSVVLSLTLTDGRVCVAKSGSLVAREARMLQALRAAGAPAPKVLGVSGEVMLLEALEETRPSPQGWQALGRGLARLHGCTGTRYGWDEDYAFGRVAIANAPTRDWPVFWAERRLLAAPGTLPADIARRIEALARQLPDLLPKSPNPSLLHGDLWSGNVLFGPAGRAHLIDPACYHGHGEVDVAMLHLFGTPGPGFRDAYGAPDPGEAARRPIYHLWPALVHLRLFGGGYRELVTGFLDTLGF